MFQGHSLPVFRFLHYATLVHPVSTAESNGSLMLVFIKDLFLKRITNEMSAPRGHRRDSQVQGVCCRWWRSDMYSNRSD